eukprot:6190813-Pleurochrysis_carterae.AAC.1
MAPGEYSDGHRQQLHRELQCKLREEYGIWDLSSTATQRPVQPRVRPEPPARSRGCQLQTLASSQARPTGKHITI